MEFPGEFLIPIAALILVAAVWYWREVTLAVCLLQRLIKRMLVWDREK
jgi:hypothetical protein